jgi:hypothetical protein
MRAVVVGALLLFATACSSVTAGEAGVRLIPERREYSAGETVSARFVNASGDRVGYGACSLSLERRTDGGWTRVAPAFEPCPSILYVLEPGAGTSVGVALEPGLPAGEYRLRQEILPGTMLPAEDVYSPVLRVSTRLIGPDAM